LKSAPTIDSEDPHQPLHGVWPAAVKEENERELDAELTLYQR